ncbi:MAG: hypothetical protein ACJAUT_000697 [Cellvibrionaceae bacterium]
MRNFKGWDLLNFLMGARTELERFNEFKISNYNLVMNRVDYCRGNATEKIIQLPDKIERIDSCNEQNVFFQKQLQHCSRVYINFMALDLRDLAVTHAGNRFVIYALFPQYNISIYVIRGLQEKTPHLQR